MILPKLGILGGGQLGKMLIQSALDLDLDISIIDPDPHCPCSTLVSTFICGDIQDYDQVYNFGKTVDLVTIEIENVNIEALYALEKEGIKVYPQPRVLESIKNKCTQKDFFVNNSIPTADFIKVQNRSEVIDNKFLLPAVNKLAVGGYDGKGVQIINSEEDLLLAFDAPGLLEKKIDFEKELAVVVARNFNGDIEAFPSVEMVFHPTANLVEYLFSPANISNEVASKAIEIAKKIAEQYKIIGLLAVEMFLTKDGQILVNEVAPRPHNSAHHTQKANFTSQFDQHLRAILNLPLGNTDAISMSAMVNLLGEENHTGPVEYEGLEKILKQKNTYPFFYGKKITKPFRKMGHVSILEPNFDKLKEKVNFVKDNLKAVTSK